MPETPDTSPKVQASPKKQRVPSGDATLGAIIRRARLDKGMTLAQLSAAVGKSVGALSQYETGEIDIAPETRVRLAIELDLSQEIFFSAPAGMYLLTPDEWLLVSRLRLAPPELRQAALLILGSALIDPPEPT